MHKEPQSADKPRFFLKFNLSHKLQLLLQLWFLLSDVLHRTNMNTDLIDFRKLA